MSNSSQSFENHARWDPLYHFFLGPVAFVTLVWTGYNAYKAHTWWAHWEIIIAIAAVIAIFKIRLYALKVQDRVIRLEERLRLATLVPNDFRPRINDLTEQQLIALRFCSDAELAAVATRALQERLGPKEIKKLIKTWRADEFRV